MAPQITVELDDETIASLTALGKPTEVLAHLAHSVAVGVRRPDHAKRELTDESLRVERDKADTGVAEAQIVADEVVRIARGRADQVVRTARDLAEQEHGPQSTAGATGSERAARTVLEHERSNADAVLVRERVARKRGSADSLRGEREATDRDLTGERAHADTTLVDQREANAQMVGATIRAHEVADEADAARERAEEGERQLRAVAEFREMFIGILGHDLRNPLGAIVLSAATLLRRDRLDEQDAKTVARIIRSSQRMTRMITQLLDLTRARLGGGMPIDPKPTDLREICGNVVEEFDAPIQLEVEGDMTGTWDEDRLAEVLSNLAGNAAEYAASGTDVIVRAHADGPEVVVEITNQGEPIPADQLPFIFEPFRRGKPRAPSKTGNLGLGLYIADQIVRSHGGTLHAHSDDGTTTFAMRLPRLAPQVASTHHRDDPPPAHWNAGRRPDPAA